MHNDLRYLSVTCSVSYDVLHLAATFIPPTMMETSANEWVFDIELLGIL